MAQLLFAGIRCRKDAHTAISSLTTRVRKPDEDNWNKLRILLEYLKRTIKLPLILQADRVNVLKWWVDASYAAHDDMRGNTGGTIPMGKDRHGSVISISKKQKLNKNILTEAELIWADNAMPHMLWTRCFLKAQGYGIDNNIFYQDNMSEMLLEKKGKKSSTKNTKHINVRYYFIKDRLETGDVVINHCPTEEMLGDIFTNPLQGSLFRNFRAEIMNIPDDLDMVEMGMDRIGLKKGLTCKLNKDTDTGFPQECVGDCGKLGRENGDMELPGGGTHNGTYNSVILENGERSRAVISYADVIREDIKTPLGQNRLIIP